MNTTFIEVRVRGVTDSCWINPAQIVCVAEHAKDGCAVISTACGSVYFLDIRYQEFLRVLKDSGCRMFARVRIGEHNDPVGAHADPVGPPGVEGEDGIQ